MSDEEPVVQLDPDALLDQPVAIDAHLDVKARFFHPTLNAPVRGPGQAETVAGVPVGARRAVPNHHNWVPIGPRNVGGRLRDVVVDPFHPELMFAAAAAGGVFKSVDGGESWFALWHDEPSLSMAALAICPVETQVVVAPDVATRTVWAGTGESRAGALETIPAAGVLFSDDDGVTWRGPNPGPPREAILDARIHAIAAHPRNRKVCWAAAMDDGVSGGLYRTVDEGRTWHCFAAGRGFADVKFATFPGNVLRLFAVPEGPVVTGPPQIDQAFVIRIDNPDDTDANLDGLMPAFTGPYDAAANRDPLRAIGVGFTGNEPTPPVLGKLAIFEGTAAPPRDPRVFVAYTHEDREPAAGPPMFVDRSFYGIFRIRNAHSAAPNAMNDIRQIRPGPTFGSEGQGGYNIAFAVDPTDPNQLAFGMVELYFHRTADATNPLGTAWLRAQMWDLYMIDRGHHADHHALLFAPVPAAPFNHGATAGTTALWDANDGGLSWCPNVNADAATGAPAGVTYPVSIPPPGNAAVQVRAILPLPANAFTWRKRSHGIVAAQMYDLTQHPRLPSVLGSGYQDNGVYVGSGGPSWQLVVAADGGFVAFDPDDPYHAIVTTQNNVRDLRFPGRLRDAAPMLGDTVITSLFPRVLNDGVRDVDATPFVVTTTFHPRLSGRVYTSKENRLYATRKTSGERWSPEPLGNTFEIIARPPTLPAPAPAAPALTIEVLDTAGGRAIGLVAQRSFVAAPADGSPTRIRLRPLAREPFALTFGLEVHLQLWFVAPPTPVAPQLELQIPLTIGPDLPLAPTSGQLAAHLTKELRRLLAAEPDATRADVEALPLITTSSREILIASTNVGHARTVAISGTALTMLAATARTFAGADAGASGGGLPAIAPIVFFTGGSGVDLTGTDLHVERDGLPGLTHPVDIDCDVAFGAHRTRVTPAMLYDVLRDKLPSLHYHVWASTNFQGVRLSSLAASNVLLQGNLPPDLTTTFAAPARTVRITAGNGAAFFPDMVDLQFTAPPPPPPPPPPSTRTLRLREAANRTALQNLDPAFMAMAAADLTSVTMVEFVHALRQMIDAVPAVRMRCDLEIGPDGPTGVGEISELTFGPPGSNQVWAGDNTGRLYRSTDDGERWQIVPSPLAERDTGVRALAVHATNHLLVVAGTYLENTSGAGEMIMRTTDGGATWVPAAAPPALPPALPPPPPPPPPPPDRLGVQAFEYDPGEPDHLYAATDQGVFRSIDAGDNWAPFNEGLPNVRVTDLALCRETRMLRAGAWGRGVYERNLGGLDPKDVRLYVRSTVLDEGISQPGPGPDVFAATPLSVRFDESPDIKLTRTDPRVGVLLDGVEFDDEVRTGDVREGPGFVSVQVHNRGAFPAGNAPPPPPRPVRVTALWAPAEDGPPPVPVALWAALANPIAPGTTFPPWTVIGDADVTGPTAGIHDIVAAGAPRVVVFGAAPAFVWPAPPALPRRVGVLAIVRSPDDPLGAAPTVPADVLDLVRSEPKIAYREAAVIPTTADDSVVLRSVDGVPFRVAAGAPAAANAANGAAPLGLAVSPAAGALDARFTIAGPYNVTARRNFTISQTRTVTVNFASDDPLLPNLARVTNNDASAVIDRAVRLAGAPIRAVFGQVFLAAPTRHALRLIAFGPATFTVAGTAVTGAGNTNLGLAVAAGAPVATRTTPFANRGPWDLSGAPRAMTITVTTVVAIAFSPGVREIPVPAAASALQVRAAINRQLRHRGVLTVVAEPIRRSLSVRRSATEATAGRDVLGGFALADLVASPVAVVGDAAMRALFDVVATHGVDRLTPGANNDLYLRSANSGNLAEAAVRHRLFLVNVTVSPLTFADLGAPVPRPIPAESSIIVPFTTPIPPLPSGSHQFVLCVADVDEPGQQVVIPPSAADIASIDTLHAFCLRTPGTALREFLVT